MQTCGPPDSAALHRAMLGSASVLLCVMVTATTAAAGAPPEKAAAREANRRDGGHHAAFERAARQVLDRPQFEDLSLEPQPPLGALGEIGQWIADRYFELVEWIRNLPAWAQVLVIGWMVLTLLAVLAHIIYTLLTATGRWRFEPGRGGRDGGQVIHGVAGTNAIEIEQRARQLAAQQRWADAVRHLYVAALFRLHEAGIVRPRPSMTNGAYLRAIARHGLPNERFTAMTQRFEAVAYGGRPASRQGYEQMLKLYERWRHDTAGH